VKRLVLLGGGHAHIEVLRQFGGHADAAVGVTLVSPSAMQLYSGMVPGVIAGHYRIEDCAIDLVELASRAHASFVRSAAVLVNTAMQEVICANGAVVPYDVLSIDVGPQPFTAGAKGVLENAFVVRPLDKLLAGWDRVLAGAREGRVRAVSMVGGGAAGVELALAMQYRLQAEMGAAAPHVRIITDTPAPLAEFSDSVRMRLRRIVQGRDIGSHVMSPVAEVGANFVRLANGNTFASDATFWSAGAGAPAWIAASGLQVDARGFLAVNDFMQSVSHPAVFGAGDCATSLANPRPKAGVFAVRAGPALARNLRAALSGGALEEHVTSPRYLALLATGGRHALGIWGPFAFAGNWVWRWKDRIDRRFVAKYASGEAFPPLR
jgi:pyridine nucleotide-disulfide oxidoreductase family protein